MALVGSISQQIWDMKYRLRSASGRGDRQDDRGYLAPRGDRARRARTRRRSLDRAVLRGADRFQVPAGGPGRRRRRQRPLGDAVQLLCHGRHSRRHGRDLCASARSGADDAAGRRHRLRLLDPAAARRAGQGRGRRRFGAALLHGCVGRDVPHDHERRLSPRRDDGDPALRPSRHRGLHRGQARAGPAAHVQPFGAGDGRIHEGRRGECPLGIVLRRP